MAPLTGDLEPGTYRWDEQAFTRQPLQLTVPDGWQRQLTEGNFIFTGAGTAAEAFDGDGVLLATWLVSHVYRDACAWRDTLEAVPTTDDVVQALTDQVGHATTGPTATTLGGLPATRFEFSVPAGFDAASCDDGLIRLWPDEGPNERFGLPIGPGQVMTVYVVDVDGQAQLVIAIRNADSPAEIVAELDGVVESIQFDP